MPDEVVGSLSRGRLTQMFVLASVEYPELRPFTNDFERTAVRIGPKRRLLVRFLLLLTASGLVLALTPTTTHAQSLQPCRILSDEEQKTLGVFASREVAPAAHARDASVKNVEIEASRACLFLNRADRRITITISRASSTDDASRIAAVVEQRTSPSRAFTEHADQIVLTVEADGLDEPAMAALRGFLRGRATERPSSCASADEGRPVALWMDTDPEPLSLELLAQRTAPILWFSPVEPVRFPIPLAIPDSSWTFPDVVASRPVVYYRIRRVTLKGANDTDRNSWRKLLSGTDVVRQIWPPAEQLRLLAKLDEVFIRFMFYFPEDVGIGRHAHDLEAAEMAVKILPCRPASDGPCRHKAVLKTVTTSAHGVGWYTGILDVCAAPDTRLPITLLVEEGKHATTPDRDGDGEFKPHYDVNVNSNDAWGVRDTAATKRLGGATFRADMTKRRPHSTQVLPLRDYVNERIRESSGREFDGMTFEEVDRLLKGAIESVYTNYALSWSSSASLCQRTGTYDDRRQRFLSDQSGHQPTKEEADAAEGLFSLLEGKGFCDPTEVVNPSEAGHRFARALNTISPGPRNEYGFMNEWQRISIAYRHDGGSGVSGIVPLGFEMPSIGGWLVGKIDVIFSDWNGKAPDKIANLGLGGLYSPSASRFLDWYVSAGAERIDRDGQPRGWQVAEEIGMRFRFAILKFPMFKFYGGRAGIRANSLGRPRNVRFTFEIGAGSW